MGRKLSFFAVIRVMVFIIFMMMMIIIIIYCHRLFGWVVVASISLCL